MKLSDLLDTSLLQEEIQSGYVSVMKDNGFSVLNYTHAAQFEQRWNEATTQCRGLIVDFEDNVVARPFPKFFNLGEEENGLPDSDAIVSEKHDGSLGIIFHGAFGYRVATRGSLASDQAIWATNKLCSIDYVIPKNVTLLVEIIYPENRIVVDYKDYEGLILLAAIDNETGEDVDIDTLRWDAERVERKVVNADEAHKLAQQILADDGSVSGVAREGIVLCYPNAGSPSKRIKLKYPDYVRLHRLITGVSPKRLMELIEIKGYEGAYETAAEFPDELHEDVRNFIHSLQQVETQALQAATLTLEATEYSTRKELAEQIIDSPYKSIIFALEDNNASRAAELAWKHSKREHERLEVFT